MKKNSKIFVAGHKGLVGSAILRKLQKEGYKNIVTRTHKELDLINAPKVTEFFKKEKIEYVFMAAAKVGGIMANKNFPAEMIYQNIEVQNNIIHNSYLTGVKKLLFLGSSCIYPRLAPQPIKEEYLLSGLLEPTNQAYAIAKISGIVMCQSYNKEYGTNFISAMPTNLYGPNDNFDYENSHVFPAMIRKFHDAKEKKEKSITFWGTGTPKREFLHVDDVASASLFLMLNYNDSEIINVGTGEDISILELVNKMKKIIGYNGKVIWDKEKPDGMPRKLLDVSKIHNLGWKHIIDVDRGITETYEWFSKNVSK
ncbi:MAG: GDP-L-fucose synthase [Candidatus Zambryskibacteria bacterium]|nr:GDP-L-fucose synthase [Candidatus Zambryskibacteria bacterium]